MSTFTGDNIDVKINVIQDVSIDIEGETKINENDYDYILDVDLSKSFIVNGNWVTNPVLLAQMLITNNISIISHGIKINNTKNICVVSRDNGSILLSINGGNTYSTITLDQSGSRLSRATISNGYYPGYIILCSHTKIYTSNNTGISWSNINMPYGSLPNNSIPYCHVSIDGKIQIISYSYVNQTMDSTNIPSYFLISLNYGNTWTKVNLSYRQLELNWLGTSIYYTTYGASPTLYYTNISSINLNNITWNQLKQFITPATGYCPIFSISDTGQYITEYHIYNTTNNTIINTSNDFGFTWSSVSTPYLINNAHNLDVVTMSLSGKIMSFWVYDTSGNKYLAYSINYGASWENVEIYNMSTDDYGVYDITDDGSHILLYQSSLNSLLFLRLSVVMNDLFTTFTYEQDQKDATKVTLRIAANNNTFGMLFSDLTSIYSIKTDILAYSNAYTSLDKTLGSIGYKLLQVIATKLFGNPLTMAAILNDTEFINLTSSGSVVSNNIISGLVNAIYAKADSLFKQYVGSGIYNLDGYGLQSGYGDSTTPLTFNLHNTSISVPLNLVGSLAVVGSNLGTMAAGLALIKNGVNAGGTRIVNGVYDIPFLLKFRYGS